MYQGSITLFEGLKKRPMGNIAHLPNESNQFITKRYEYTFTLIKITIIVTFLENLIVCLSFLKTYLNPLHPSLVEIRQLDLKTRKYFYTREFTVFIFALIRLICINMNSLYRTILCVRFD